MSKPRVRHRDLPLETKVRRYAAIKRWKAANPEKVREYARRARAKRTGYMRQYLRKRLYGLGPGEFEALLRQQDWLCAICREEFGGMSPGQGPYVDHDHTSGHRRGLLCAGCNGALGYVERAGWVEAAGRYLASAKKVA